MTKPLNTGRLLLSSKSIVVLILVVIDLINVESKALQSAKSRSVNIKTFPQSSKWLSWKFCGKLGDFCKADSRKHCCAVGFTCVLSLKQLYKKIHRRRRYGRCQPVPTVAMKHREVTAFINPTKKRS